MRTEIRSKGRLQTFAGGAMLLAGAGLVSKILGAIYRIPLTNILGAEGIGLYQLIFPIYAFMLTVSSSGIPTIIARKVSEYNAKKDNKSIKDLLLSAVILLLVLSSIATAVMCLLSAPIAKWQGNEAIKFAYYAVAPSILIVAGTSFLKGYFQGNMDMLPSAAGQLTEQAVKMSLGLILAYALIEKGIIYAVVGSVIALTIAEGASFAVMLCMYLARPNRLRLKNANPSAKSAEIIKISTPIMLSGMIMPISQFIDSLLVVNVLKYKGLSTAGSTAQYGLLSGSVASLINMPIVITLALAVAVVPVVAHNYARRDAPELKRRATTAIKLCYIIAVPAFFFFYVFAEHIIFALYPALAASEKTLSVTLLRISSVQIILMGGLQVYTSLMQAFGRSIIPMRNLAVGMAVKVVLSVLLIAVLGIKGAALSSIIGTGIACALNQKSFKNELGKNFILLKNISKILCVSAIMGLVMIVPVIYIPGHVLPIVIGALVGGGIYVTGVLALKVLDYNELQSIPLGGFLAKVSGIKPDKHKEDDI